MNVDISDIRNYNNFDDEDWAVIRMSRYKDVANLVLVTPMVFIGDVDAVDGFSKKQALENILSVEKQLNKDYRIYETYKGYRIFDVEQLYDLGNREQRLQSINIMEALRSDEKYIYFCQMRKKYAARLTPKVHRPEESKVCDLVKLGAEITLPEVFTVVKMHDDMCFSDNDWCDTWRGLDTTKREPPSSPPYNHNEPF